VAVGPPRLGALAILRFLRSLAALELRAVADALTHQARELYARADLLDEREAERQARRPRLDHLGQAVAVLVSEGRSIQEAAHQVAAATGAQVGTVLWWYEKDRKAAQEQERSQRNRAIMRLAAKGWSNAEIAARYNLSPSTVSRIIGEGKTL
jgi:DNA-binding NarL/FixJ family response regulator